jgi:hypothetical protein
MAMYPRNSLVMVLTFYLLCSLLTVPTHAQSAKVQSVINNAGNIVYNAHSILYVDGTKLRGPSGKEVFLKGIQVDWNERMKKQGTSQEASNPYESWFTEADIQTMKANGANYVEIHMIPLKSVMPIKNVFNTEYFEDWVDVWVQWATNNQMYVSLDMMWLSYTSYWHIPDWLWEDAGYDEPTNKAEWDAIIRDFFDTDVTAMDTSRDAFINAWKGIANRYKSNDYVLFSIINEPFMLVDMVNQFTNNHLAETYSGFMEDVVDGIHSTGATNIIIINRPYVNAYSPYCDNVKPVNRSGIVWEDHLYISSQYDYDDWCSKIDQYVARLVGVFGKPLIIGEYGFLPANYGKTEYRDTWLSILEDEVSYLDGKTLCGRQYHQWGWLEGQCGDYAYDYYTEDESEWIIQTVLGSSY